MADKSDPNQTPKALSDETIARMRSEFVHGTGYQRPPKEHQFKPGTSGNPKGRPRGAARDLSLDDEPLLRAALKAMSEMVSVRKNGKTLEMPVRDALMQAAVAGGIKGNARTLGLLFDLERTATQAKAREIRESNELWSRYKEVYTHKLRAAAEQGESPPIILPHPDDVIIDWESGPRFLGPFDEEQQRELERTLQLREVLIMQSVLDERMCGHLHDKDERERCASMLAMLLDRSMPPRLRLPDLQWIIGFSKYERLTQRELLKLLYASWRKIGRPQKRGYISQKLSVMVAWIDDFKALKRGVDAGELDVEAMSRGVFDDAALRFMEERGLH